MQRIRLKTLARKGASLLSYSLLIGLVGAVALVAIDRSGASTASLMRNVADLLDGSAVAQSSGSPLPDCTSNGQTGCTTGSGYVAAQPASSGNGDDGDLVMPIPTGFHDGSTTMTASDTDLAASNILLGVNIFGVIGTAADCSPGQCIKSDGTCGNVRLILGVVNHPSNTAHCCGTSHSNTPEATWVYTDSGTQFADTSSLKGAQARWLCD